MATRNQDFEIDLKMRAEFSDAQRELVRTQKQLEALSRSVAKANRDIVTAGGGAASLAPAAKAMERTALSAKQLQAATRQLPMQFTDIFTSLAAGQNPMQVLLQQGGQLKDVFGGTGPALRATAGYIGGLINPLTVSAAAVGTLAFAWHQGQQEQQAFNRALIESGGFVGVTAQRLAEMSQAMADGSTTQREAAAALAAVAGSGQFTSQQLQLVTQAALDLERVAGVAVEDTVAKFAKLADEPTKAVLSLNESMHFLTLEIYEQIKSLEEQGRTQDAATLAMSTYADELSRRTSELEENLGILERAFNGLGIAAKKAWDFMLDIGRPDTGQEKFASLHEQVLKMQETLQTRESGGFSLSFLQLDDQQLRQRIAEARDKMAALADENVRNERQAARDAAAQRAEEAAIALDQEAAGYASAEEKRAKRIAAARQDANEAVALAMEAGNTDLVAKIREDEAAIVKAIEAEGKKTTRKPRTRQTDAQRAEEAAQRQLASLKEQVALLDMLEKGETRVSEAAKARYDTEQGALKAASAGTKQQLLEQAHILDVERARRDVTEQMVRVQERIAQLRGRGDEAALEKTLGQLDKLRNEALRLGEAAEAAQIGELMGLEKAGAQLQQLQQQFDAFGKSISAAEQRIDIERENGLITGIEAQRRLLELRQKEMAEIALLLPQLEATAAAYGDQVPSELLERIAALRNQLLDLQTQGTLLQTTFRNTFESGLSDALYGLADGTKSVRDAALGLIDDMVAGMARLASQQLANIATTKLMSAIFKNSSGPADVGQGAQELEKAAIATGLAGGAVKFGADALSKSSKELLTAAAALAAANAAGSLSGFGFAEGGFTGYGGKYQVAGWVHRGEGVLSQAEIRALGGPGGFYALRHAIAAGALPARFAHAPAVSASPAPRYSFAEGGFAGGALPAPQVNLRNQNIVALDIEGLAQAITSSSTFERATLNVIHVNANTISREIASA